MKASEFRKLALALEGTTELPHFERAAFRTKKRIFATLASDGTNANLRIDPDVQQAVVDSNPKAFEIVNGAWGAQGWTRVLLAHATASEVKRLLLDAHALTLPTLKRR